jgi:hypothetical protein
VTLPIVTYPDAEAELVTYLRAVYADRDEAFKPAESAIATKMPATLTGGITYVQVVHETSPGDDYPAKERAQVRVVCWAPGDHRSDVKSLASLTQGLLNSHPGSAGVGNVRTLIGRSTPTTDPDTKNLMCWFLVRVNLRGTQLAS